MFLPHGAMGSSAVFDCGVSWAYPLTVYCLKSRSINFSFLLEIDERSLMFKSDVTSSVVELLVGLQCVIVVFPDHIHLFSIR